MDHSRKKFLNIFGYVLKVVPGNFRDFVDKQKTN